MNPGRSKRGKSAAQKKKSVKGVLAAPEQLGEDDRVLEVRVRATIRPAAEVPEASLQSRLHCVFNGEEQVFRLDHIFAAQEEETPAKGRSQRHTPPSKGLQDGDVDFFLAQRQVHLDLATLASLLSTTGAGEDKVMLRGPPPPATPSTTTANAPLDSSSSSPGTVTGRGKGRKGHPAAKGPDAGPDAVVAGGAAAPVPPSAASQSARGKRKASTTGPGSRAGPLVGGPIGDMVVLSFLDVMRVSEYEYPLALDIPGIHCCRVVLRSRGGCLTPPPVLKRFRPVCFTIRGISSLPNATRGSPAAVLLEGVGHRVVSTPLSCIDEHCAGDRPTVARSFRTVRFLGDKPPLSVYQSVLLDPVRVSVLCDGGPAGSDKGSNATTPSAATVLGTGFFSVRALITDQQTLFDEAVSLLPASRASAVASGPSNCLTAGSVIRCTIDFFLPLPPLLHVDESGRPAPKEALMTRGVAILSYSAPWIPSAIECLLRELMKSHRAVGSCNVQLYEEPPPPSTPDPPHELLGSTASGVAGGACESSTPFSVDAASVRNGASTMTSTRTQASGAPTNLGSKRGSAGGTRAAGKETTSTAVAGGGSGEAAGELGEREKWPFVQDSVRVVSPAGISGFEVSDGEQRILCLEGPAGEIHRIFTALHDVVETHGATSVGGLRLLLNPELFAARRLYTTFPPLVTPPVCGGSDAASGDARTEASSATVAAAAADAGEVDEMGGGCGGRIHRIRLRESIAALMAQQRFLLRRTLSEACLRCILQLDSLVRCPTLREATMRDLFPSAAGIVSLERSFGQTLELTDIFGQDGFVAQQPWSEGSDGTDTLAARSVAVAKHPWEELLRANEAVRNGASSAALSLATTLDPSSPGGVGHLVAFQGVVRVGKPRAIPADVAARFPRCGWMTSDEGTEVLCAFGKETPVGTVRYHVEGQVMQSGLQQRVLYVLELHTLAKSSTNTHNRAYERTLASRRRKEAARALGTHRLPSTESRRFSGDGHARVYSGQQSAASFLQPLRRADIGSSSSDDDGENDAHNPPRVADSPAASRVALPGCNGSASGGELPIVGTTKTSQLRATLSHANKPPEVDYELLWELYDKRAPKQTASS